jgi:hypothetical protein
VTTATFLDPDEVATLTGRKRKSMQIEALRRMGLSFWVNACGRPVVARTAIDGKKDVKQPKTWESKEK